MMSDKMHGTIEIRVDDSQWGSATVVIAKSEQDKELEDFILHLVYDHWHDISYSEQIDIIADKIDEMGVSPALSYHTWFFFDWARQMREDEERYAEYEPDAYVHDDAE